MYELIDGFQGTCYREIILELDGDDLVCKGLKEAARICGELDPPE